MSIDNPLGTSSAGPGDPEGLAPGRDHPAAGPGSLPIPNDAASAIQRRRGLPFAARFQAILVGVMFVAFFLIAQGASKTLYQVGLPLLMLAAFFQIAFGNIPPRANFATSMKLLALTWMIVGGVFALGIVLAPFLIDLGR